MKNTLKFQATIDNIERVNPTFSSCRIVVMYKGDNANMSSISKEAVERALPTIKNIPIVGEFSVDADDFKGHGGSLDLETGDFIETTKPYGVVPESATYEWVENELPDGSIREYLVIDGCYLWSGRYNEVKDLSQGKGQSMEITVTDGEWNDERETYVINDFIFSALCILGDDVTPAFEGANVTTYKLNENSEFELEFNKLKEQVEKYERTKEDGNVFKELLEKYNLKIEDLNEAKIDYNNMSTTELEEAIQKAFDTDGKADGGNEGDEGSQEGNAEGSQEDEDSKDDLEDEEGEDEDEETLESYKLKVENLEEEIKKYKKENESLKKFKEDSLKEKHELEAEKLFTKLNFTEEDIKEIDIHKFTIEELENHCYAVIGKKLMEKENKEDLDNIKFSIVNQYKENDEDLSYESLFIK